MGLEKETAETCVFLDENVFHSTIEPILQKKKQKARAPLPDRDPRDISAHLKVSHSKRCRIAVGKDLEMVSFLIRYRLYRGLLSVLGVISVCLCD